MPSFFMIIVLKSDHPDPPESRTTPSLNLWLWYVDGIMFSFVFPFMFARFVSAQ